ncbi:MAG: hypothetical protein KDD36_05315 [Flavobacteriales bacterium]|nr:hypothetical protein [Flavobacteriales bacterium]
MPSNKEIAADFHLLGKLSDLHGENPFKGKSYANAAFRIERLEQPLDALTPERISSIDGIGPAIAEKIAVVLKGEEIPALTKLLEKTPEGILDIMQIKGLGPKKVRTIWHDLNIESVGELLYACYENRLTSLKGFGAKTQDQVIRSIEFMQQNRNKFHYATAEAVFELVKEQLEQTGLTQKIDMTGPLRRRCEVVTAVDLLVSTDDEGTLRSRLLTLFPDISTESPFSFTGPGGVPVQLHLASSEDWVHELFISTGPDEHTAKFTPDKNVPSEEDIYTIAGSPYVVPELRDLDPQFPPAPDDLLKVKDLKGILHVHSTYSDGLHTLEEMATRCKELGYEYLGICDHSQSAFYANGLKADRIKKQHEEIERLNEKLSPFVIFKGIESDILNDGSLDYEDAVLESFDFIVASVHSNLKMDKEKATRRVLNAVCNPHTTILGHMTGRLLLSREGYPLDHEQIIEACRDHGVVIELNAHPYRLDIDWRWIPRCIEAGVKISVNPDAHQMDGLTDVRYGCLAGRKGGLLRSMTFNTQSAEEVGAFFKGRH